MEELRKHQNDQEVREPGRQAGIRCETKAEEESRDFPKGEIVVKGQYPQCPRCSLVLDPWLDCGPTLDGVCPRCAYDIANTIDMETTELVDPEVLKDQAGQKEFLTLCQILKNWLDGYMKLIDRRGLDWSIPHEFFQEFAEQMVPYISRLKETGYATPERMRMVGDMVTNACCDLIERLQQEEDLLRLGGAWTDQEQEIKDYWKKQGGIDANLRISM